MTTPVKFPRSHGRSFGYAQFRGLPKRHQGSNDDALSTIISPVFAGVNGVMMEKYHTDDAADDEDDGDHGHDHALDFGD